MTDQSVGLDVARKAHAPRARAIGWVHPRTVFAVAGLATMAILVRLWLAEGFPSTILYSGLVCATIAAVVLIATRRILVAVVVVSAVVVLVSVGAHVKRQAINLVLHAYDLVFYLPQAATIAFLWDSYRAYVLGALAALALTGLLIWIAWRCDSTRIARRVSVPATFLLALGVYVSAHVVGERRHTQMEWAGLYLTTFFQSWSETIETLWRGQIMEAAAGPSLAPPFRLPTHCDTTERPPHIILVHHESIVQPSLFPTLAYDRSVDPFFRSDDGRTRKLRVETYGGASTMTEFSAMTGLSTYSFGGMRQFVQWVMASKIEDTLPKVLAACGYRNTLFYPMLKSFLFAEKFFKGVGIPEIFDLKRQGATRVNERDRFYYDSAMNELSRHISGGDSRPMFAFVETMATHWPYQETYEPHLKVSGGGPGTHPEMHEYLRRLSIAKQDYDYLAGELARRFPGERFLIVRYGDHHPMSTRFLLGWGSTPDAEDVLLPMDSVGFITFYAINGVNYRPRLPVTPDPLDVPYLSTALLQAAGLPLPESYDRRRDLMVVCNGRFYTCADKARILAFKRRLINSGIVQAR